ncbi:unnamed protein product, partial [Brassica rapa subsp. trilocularis]
LLKIRKVKDHDTRLKIACLAITSSILLSSSHTPRIIPDYLLLQELSPTLDTLYSYPSGRVSFHFLVTNIISKDEVSLAQSSVALKGQVDSIQQVLVAAVPMLK